METNKTQRRRQTVVVTLANAAPNNTLTEATIVFDKKYDRAIGVAAVLRSGGGFSYQLGVLTPRDTPIDLADSSLLISNATVAPDNKFASFGNEGIPVVDGEEITVQIKNVSGANALAATVVEFAFLLEKDLIVQQ
jgi:hypothetical protein